jgi:hypothetical protein
VSDDPQKPGAVAAGDDATRTDAERAQETAARTEGAAQAERTAAEARATEVREELAITDERRAEEEVAKAEAEREAAEKEQEKREQKRREADERRKAAAEEAERARSHASQAGTATDEPTRVVSAASVTSPGVGIDTDPKAAATAAPGATARPQPVGPRLPEQVEGPEKPEIQVAAAFAGAFLFARILKAIAD